MDPGSSPTARDANADGPRPGRATWAGRATGTVLALLVVLALASRLCGIGFLAPHLMEPDGLVVDYQMRVLDGRGTESAEHPLYAYYPHLVARIAMLVPESWVAPAEPRTLEENLATAGAFRLRARIAVTLLSLLAIPLTWRLARAFLPDPWPLLAAALVAGSPFVLWFAQQARPHAAATSFMLLAVCAAVGLRRAGGWRAYAAVAMASGLAVGSLQNGLAVLGAVGVAILLRIRKDRWRTLAGAAAVVAVTGACVLWLYPFLSGGGEKDGVGVARDGTLAVSRHQVFLHLFNGRGFPVVWRTFADYDPLLFGSALLGLAAACVAPFLMRAKLGRERAQDLAVVLAFALPYLVVIGLYQRTYQRFALPLVPFVAILAAFGFWAAWRGARRVSPAAGAGVAALAVLVAAAEIAWSFRIGAVRARTDTVQEAAAWIASNARPGVDRVDVMPGLDLPILRTPESIRRDDLQRDEQSLPWFRRQSDPRRAAIEAPAYDLAWMDLVVDANRAKARADPRGFARSLTGKYAVVIVWPQGFRAALWAVREGLREEYDIQMRFTPDAEDVREHLPLAHQDDELPYRNPWAWRAATARCFGPTVEIYRRR